jgi:uncharacterized delta-60 repeat protein
MRKTFVFAAALVCVQISLFAITVSQERTWGGPDVDEAEDVAVASDGSVYVTGTTLSFGVGDRDAFLLKFAPDGSLEWQRTYGTARVTPFLRADEFADGVAAGPDGSAYVTGQSGASIFVVKFDAFGNLVWQRLWGQNGDFVSGVEVSADGSVYVAGGSFVRGAGHADVLLVKFTAAGDVLWAKTWGGASTDSAHDLAIGSDGSIYVAGETNSFFWNDAILLKFAADGSLVWAREWGSMGTTVPAFTIAWGVGTAPDGSVCITGASGGIGSESLMVVKFDAASAVLWQTLSGPPNSTAFDVAAGADGTLYVSGFTPDSFHTIDAIVFKFLENGRPREAIAWGGADEENAPSVAVAPDGSIAVGGWAGAPPYTSRRVHHRTRQPNAFLLAPEGTVTSPTDVASIAVGLVTTPNGSLTFGGARDAAFVRLQP